VSQSTHGIGPAARRVVKESFLSKTRMATYCDLLRKLERAHLQRLARARELPLCDAEGNVHFDLMTAKPRQSLAVKTRNSSSQPTQNFACHSHLFMLCSLHRHLS